LFRVTVKTGRGIIVLHGHNLKPLFAALEEQALQPVKARSELGIARCAGNGFLCDGARLFASSPTPAANLLKYGASKGQLSLKLGGWEEQRFSEAKLRGGFYEKPNY